jgi:hypothetical protein
VAAAITLKTAKTKAHHSASGNLPPLTRSLPSTPFPFGGYGRARIWRWEREERRGRWGVLSGRIFLHRALMLAHAPILHAGAGAGACSGVL